jgi:hypothetical protein
MVMGKRTSSLQTFRLVDERIRNNEQVDREHLDRLDHGTGDFNGDGKADIFLRDVSGNVVIPMMNGASVSSWSSLGKVSDRLS